MSEHEEQMSLIKEIKKKENDISVDVNFLRSIMEE